MNVYYLWSSYEKPIQNDHALLNHHEWLDNKTPDFMDVEQVLNLTEKNKKIIVKDIGRTEFSYSWRYQESIFDKIIAQKVKNRVSKKKSNTKEVHPHFLCEDCGTTSCIPINIKLPSIPEYILKTSEHSILHKCFPFGISTYSEFLIIFANS